MEVILLESFNKLGDIGDTVNVKDGFARNFLIPQKKALRANTENKEYFSRIKKDLIEKNNKFIQEAKSLIKKISDKEIVFIRNASDNGQLYGSVSPKDISNYFESQKINIKPSNINLHFAIKKIGIYDINIKLHPEVGCNLKINVATSEENAESQKKEVNEASNKNDSKSKLTEKSKKPNDELSNDEIDLKAVDNKNQTVKLNESKKANNLSANENQLANDKKLSTPEKISSTEKPKEKLASKAPQASKNVATEKTSK